MEKEILRGKFERKRQRIGVIHTRREDSNKKHLKNQDLDMMSKLELEDYLHEDEEDQYEDYY